MWGVNGITAIKNYNTAAPIPNKAEAVYNVNGVKLIFAATNTDTNKELNNSKINKKK